MKNFMTHGELTKWASHYAEIKKSDKENENKWLFFQLDNERFTIHLDYLEEITPVQNGIRLSSGKMHIMGLMNLRGEIAVIADLGQVIGLRQTPGREENQRILFITDKERKHIGFLVDQVEGISSLDRTHKQDHVAEKNEISKFIKFIGENNGKPVACIDIPAVLRETWNH